LLSNQALLGDLVEQFESGRSGAWYRRQVLMAIIAGTVKEISAHKLLAVRAVITGWVVLVVVFGVLGDLVAYALAQHLWGWTVEVGYGSGIWWPFWLSAGFVSYGGFALSAGAVTGLHRRHAAPMLLMYAGSLFAVLLASAATISWLGPGPVRVPHTLFYIVSVTLSYQWRSGFVFVPVLFILVGILSAANLREERGRA
jgi:hypothetical protein